MKLLLKLIILFVLSACAQESPPLHKAKVLSFGTYVDVTLYGVTEERARKAILQVEEQLNVMHDQWHAWRPSNITALNDKLRSGKQFTIDAGMLPLVTQSKKLYSASNGYFNPAIGELIELWGFYKDDPQSNKSIPEASVIEDYVTKLPTMDDVHIENDLVSGSNSRLKLDFGGYAKGYGVEQLIR
ncbi:MAG: FAD:protein FMN transferase, partial [Gammaproteobacteria bacterium]|nr:FAD:protein FMN transferase [Gammaproteobacteria bacterium]